MLHEQQFRFGDEPKSNDQSFRELTLLSCSPQPLLHWENYLTEKKIKRYS